MSSLRHILGPPVKFEHKIKMIDIIFSNKCSISIFIQRVYESQLYQMNYGGQHSGIVFYSITTVHIHVN